MCAIKKHKIWTKTINIPKECIAIKITWNMDINKIHGVGTLKLHYQTRQQIVKETIQEKQQIKTYHKL